MQFGLSIGTVDARAPAGSEGALLDADFANDRFSYAGNSLPGLAAFRTAIGGTHAPGGELLIGPHLAENATELIANGDFSEGVGDWQTNGGALAIVDGALQATGIGGNTTNTWLPIHTLIDAGRAYRLAAKVRRGTTNNVRLGFGAPVSTHNYSGSSNITATTMTPVEVFCGGLNPIAAVIAVRHIVNPSNGTYYVDDVSLKEVTPLAGFLPGQLCGRIEAVTPASGEIILFQADDNATYENAAVERNFIRLVWDADGHLRFIVSYGGTGSLVEQANLDLGEVAPETPFTVHFSAQANDFKAALEGRPVQSDTSGSFPGLAVLRLGKGRSNSEKLWGGSIDRLVLWPAAQSDNEFLAAAAGNGIAVWGDSLTVGTGASSTAASFPVVAQNLFSPPRAISRQAVGGQTSTQIAARMNALPVLVTLSRTMIS